MRALAMSNSTFPDFGEKRSLMKRLGAQFGPLAAIVVAHAVFFYLIYSGMLNRVVQATLPEAVFVSFLAPAAPAKPVPAPVPPVVMAQLPPTVTLPPPVISIAPSEHAISLPSPPPAATPAEPALPVFAASAVPAPRPTEPRTITSGVQYIHAPQPIYPLLSKRMGEQGKVVLRVLVNEKGQPDQVLVQTSSGSPRLDEAGRQAALKALFKPHLEDGHPVAVFVIVPLNFQLTS